MKNLLLHASFILATCSSLYAGEPAKPNQPNLQVNNLSVRADYESAIVVNQNEWNSLTSSYQPQNGTPTVGGSINKADLQNFLSNLPSSCSMVYFRFFTDTAYQQTSVGFSGGRAAENAPCIRNGGSDKAFCPTACNLKTASCPKALVLSYDGYKNLSVAYQRKNPESTLGGNIDKAALLAIIGSLPGENNTINIRFCTDPAYKQTSIIFMGGTVGQSEQQILYLRNGLSAESFCPTNCNMD